MSDSWIWAHIKAVAQVSQSSSVALGSCAGPRRIFLAQWCRYSDMRNTVCSWVCSCILISALCAPKETRAVFYEQAKLSQRTPTHASVAGSAPEASADTVKTVKDYSAFLLYQATRLENICCRERNKSNHNSLSFLWCSNLNRITWAASVGAALLQRLISAPWRIWSVVM